MSRVLLTGGLGFIGSHIAVTLLEAGHEPIILDNLHNSDKSVLESIAKIAGKKPTWVNGDVRQIDQLREIFAHAAGPIDAVIHLAALKSVAESVTDPINYYAVNIGSLLELMRAMEEAKCYKLVFSSSATIYGQATELPITEKARICPANPYGISKMACEYILNSAFVNNPQWNIISLRYFNPAGSHASGLLGEKSDGNSQNLFAAIARYYLLPKYELKVFGKDYDTKDGTCIRDYLHVMDLARAHLLASAKCLATTQGNYQAINLGSGGGYTVLEVLKTFEKLSKQSLTYTFEPRRAGDVASCYASTNLAASILGWQTEADLETICRDALRAINYQHQQH